MTKSFGAPLTMTKRFGAPLTMTRRFGAPLTTTKRFGAPLTTTKRFGAPLTVTIALALSCVTAAFAAATPMADQNAAARASGNHRAEAIKIGRVLFATVWPAQIVRVRVDAVGRHSIAGLMLSAVKFHQAIDRAGFLNEIELLVGRTFAASAVEEVDVWATVPIAVKEGATVSGDLAEPTSRTVFAVTCRRDQLPGLVARLRNGEGVYWSADFKAKLRGGTRG